MIIRSNICGPAALFLEKKFEVCEHVYGKLAIKESGK